MQNPLILARFAVFVVLTLVVLALTGRLSPVRAEIATWYGPESGALTASGERFDPEARTCAHRTYAFGTHLRVTYRGHSVICRVNDRGPSVWTGASLDLSRGTARAIGLMQDGRGFVIIERL